MAASDSRPVPIKNTAYRVIFPILDADGDLVTGAATLDSEVSKDCGTFADCTNEATEIATSSGVYYLDLTSTEMNADSVAVIVKTGTTGAKTTTIVLYPQESGDIKVDVQSYGGTAGTFSGGRPEVNTTHAAGTAWGSGAITAASIAADAITAAKIADGAIDAATFAAGAINAAAIAADAIGASELAADAVAEIADAIWDEARAGHVAAGSFGEGVASVQGNVTGSVASVTGAVGSVTGAVGSVTGNVGGNVAGSVGSVTGAVGSVTGNVGGNVTGSVGSVATGGIAAASFAAGAIDAAAIAANAIGASELAADAVAEIADAVWDELLAGHAIAGSAGEALAAAGTAGDPWTTALPGAYGAGTAGNILGNNLNATVSSRASQTSVDTIDDFLDTEIAAILADTNELQTDWVNGGRLDLLVDAIKAKTDNLPAAPAATSDIPSAATIADAVWDEDATAHQTQGTFGQAIGDPGVDTDTIFGLLNTNLDATVSSRAAQSTVNTIDSATTAIQAKTDSLTFTVAGVVDANIQRINDVALVGTGVLGDEFRP